MDKRNFQSVMIVEDNLADGLIIKHVVESMGYKAKLIQNPNNAFQELSEKSFCLVILDWQMPDLNGIEFLRKMKSDDSLKNTPVILASGKNLIDDIRFAIRSGVSDYIVKPVDPLILESKVKSAMLNHQNWAFTEIPFELNRNQSILTTAGELLSISEIGIIIKLSSPVPTGHTCEFQSDILRKSGINSVPVRAIEQKQIDNVFITTMIFMGLKAADLKQIRILVRELHVIKKSDKVS